MYICDDIKNQISLVKSSEYFSRYIKDIKAGYEETKGKDVPELSYSTFKLFWETGDRSEYEKRYFQPRYRLNRALILYLLYEEDEYMDEICNMIWQICSEVSWALPAHFHFDNCIPENYYGYIDLFAAETALYLAETYYLIGDKLPERVAELLKSQVMKRTVESYMNNSFWWETLDCNWSAVCAGSVGMVYMYLAPERFDQVKDRILGSIECFLKGYGDDGCCREGISYWRYGFGYFLLFAEMLCRFTSGEINLMDNQKVENIAKYIDKIFLKNNTVVSFADGSMTCSSVDVWIVSYLTKYYEGFSLPKSAATPYFENFPEKLSYHVRNILWTNPELLKENGKNAPSMDYFEDANWYISKKEKYSFASKAGHNDDSHNHNDIGGFIIANELGQLIADIGPMQYTRDNFNEKRYTFLQNSSLGHSVPIIDGNGQKEGREYCGKVISVSENEFSLEIQDAYEVKLEKIERTFSLGENLIQLTDIFKDAKTHDVTERFISVIEPEVTYNGVKIGNLEIKANGFKQIKKEVLTKYKENDFEVYLVDFEVTDNKFSADFAFDNMEE